MTTSVTRWNVFCNTENTWVTGYIDTVDGTPNYCFNNNTHAIDNLRIQKIQIITDLISPDIIYWKVYCDTEGQYVYGWKSCQNVYNGQCFNNNTHQTSGNPEEIKRIINTRPKIQEESISTGSHYQAISYKIECEPGESVHDYSYPYGISVFIIKFVTTNDHLEDIMNLEVGPNTIIGIITNSITSPTNVVSVSSTVMDNIELGFYVSIGDGVNTDNLGRVIGINLENNTITTENMTSSVFLFYSPTYVFMTVKVIDNFIFGYPKEYTFGGHIIGGSYVPPNTLIRVRYINNGSVNKIIYPKIEMLY